MGRWPPVQRDAEERGVGGERGWMMAPAASPVNLSGALLAALAERDPGAGSIPLEPASEPRPAT
jgi:hypothetical protein